MNNKNNKNYIKLKILEKKYFNQFILKCEIINVIKHLNININDKVIKTVEDVIKENIKAVNVEKNIKKGKEIGLKRNISINKFIYSINDIL